MRIWLPAAIVTAGIVVGVLGVLVSLGGCDLYFQADAAPDAATCTGGGGGGGGGPSQRDPTTGLCLTIGSPPCFCGPCPPPPPPPPPGAICYGACANLLEDDCLATPGCHAAYHTPGDALGEPPPPMFDSCWDITPLTVAEGGACAGLDAVTCSLHDDCVSIMLEEISGGLQYTSCAPEPDVTACAVTQCGSGSDCDLECNAQGTCTALCVAAAKTGSCDASIVTCNTAPPLCPEDTEPGVVDHCWTGYCIPQPACACGSAVAGCE